LAICQAFQRSAVLRSTSRLLSSGKPYFWASCLKQHYLGTKYSNTILKALQSTALAQEPEILNHEQELRHPPTPNHRASKNASDCEVTVITDEIKLQAALKTLCNPDIIWACDTEVCNLDIKKEGPVGNGQVTCISIYGGPFVLLLISGSERERDLLCGSRMWARLRVC